ncbi:hypothetical protein K488DRAFT_57855, partial [Vararia minispora EC-137]
MNVLLPRRRGRLTRWFAWDMLTVVLRIFWACLIVWVEIGVFFYSLSGCRWPDAVLENNPVHTKQSSSSRPTHVLLLADVKVVPPSNGRHSISRLLDDVYLRKAWSAVSRFRPQVVVFLGDMLSSGNMIDDDSDFVQYVNRFHELFTLEPGVTTYYVPGNTDIGLGVSSEFTRHVRDRYRSYFGPLNREVRIANHSLIILDAPGLVDEDYVRAAQSISFDTWTPIRHGAIEFVKQTSNALQKRHADGASSEPVILLTHIPLHRAETKKCGPMREKGSIRRGAGKAGWQATLGKDTSQFLLDHLQPKAVFSGDDRDYCDITHTLLAKGNEVREITLKSFSPSRHIARPGFQLLSLMPDAVRPSHTSALCLLPPAGTPVRRIYMPLLALQVIFFLITNI